MLGILLLCYFLFYFDSLLVRVLCSFHPQSHYGWLTSAVFLGCVLSFWLTFSIYKVCHKFLAILTVCSLLVFPPVFPVWVCRVLLLAAFGFSALPNKALFLFSSVYESASWSKSTLFMTTSNSTLHLLVVPTDAPTLKQFGWTAGDWLRRHEQQDFLNY